MAKNFTLGRGLGSLIPSRKDEANYWGADMPANSAPIASGEQIQQLAINTIKPNPRQPRQHFDHASLEELVSSIKIHGILQPLIVVLGTDGKYDLIAGERRLRAAEIAGLKTVPAIVREANEQQSLELALVENLQRQNLNPLEEAWAYKKLQDEFSLTQEEISKRVGKSRSQVANMLRLLTLPPDMQSALQQGLLTFGHAKVLLGVERPEEQIKLFRQIMKEGLPVHLTEAKVQSVRVRGHERRVNTDPQIRQWENDLQSALGTRAKIKSHNGKGFMELAFYSLEELAELVRKIVKK